MIVYTFSSVDSRAHLMPGMMQESTSSCMTEVRGRDLKGAAFALLITTPDFFAQLETRITVRPRSEICQPKAAKTAPWRLLVVWLALIVCAGTPSLAVSQCAPWAGKAVSVQGQVEVSRSGQARWVGLKLHDVLCSGDSIRLGSRSRAAILLANETVLSLDEHSFLTFSNIQKEASSLLDLIKGAVHFISRTRRSLEVKTPFVNAAIEGTEFALRVDPAETGIWVFAGRVAFNNPAGGLTLSGGEAAVAQAGASPQRRVVVKPRDAVQWALYYPPLIDYRMSAAEAGPARDTMQEALERYRRNDLPGAFASLDGVPSQDRSAQYYTLYGGLLLSVGRVGEAQAGIAQALAREPDNATAFALRSVIALVQNQKAEALALARQAERLDPRSPVARIALSYAYQAEFNIEQALHSVKAAVDLAPQDALAWARLAELELSLGHLDASRAAARRAVEIDSELARTQSVLGFAYLAQIRIEEAQAAFEKAITSDPASPVARLGLGLARIRDGEVNKGTREIEIAAILDPDNALVRSYLGKAYYEQKREQLAATEFAIAKQLDPKDPTPYYYDAILKQTENRPVEALQDLEKSIALNDNRVVYRSRELLDQDLASRSASVARVYTDLGFGQRALVEGWNSVNTEPGNFSAHRLLADLYQTRPRREFSRVSELLQSQLLQPLNLNPLQPQLAEANLGILDGAGPSDTAFNEFNPLFTRNRLGLQLDGVAGNKDTWGNDAVVSGVKDNISISAGQFHYQTDGFRENNDQKIDLYNVFAQVALSYTTSVQAELRTKNVNKGDLPIRFTNDFNPDLDQDEDVDTARLGFRHSFTPASAVLASLIYQDADLDSDVIPGFFRLQSDVDHYVGELSYLGKTGWGDIIAGAGYRKLDDSTTETLSGFSTKESFDPAFASAYLYSHVDVSSQLRLTLGASGNHLNGTTDAEDKDQLNPKLGFDWQPAQGTSLRGAIFRTLQRPFISRENVDPTLEPTQLAGFNQFFVDTEGTDAWSVGVAADRKFRPDLYAGAELAARDLDTILIDATGPVPTAVKRDWDEREGRAYVYWAATERLALSAEYLYEWFDRENGDGLVGEEQFTRLKSHRFPLAARFFHPSGFWAGARATYLYQDGDFLVPAGFALAEISDDARTWIVDASLGYRLPKRYGLISLDVRNVFDKSFNYQDTDPGNPQVAPERRVMLRLTLSF